MNKSVFKSLQYLTASVLISLSLVDATKTHSAHAFGLRLSDDFDSITIPDNSSLDRDKEDGIIFFKGKLENDSPFKVNITASSFGRMLGGVPTGDLSWTGEIETDETKGGTFMVELTDTGINSEPPPEVFITGFTDGTFEFNAYVDSQNREFAKTDRIYSSSSLTGNIDLYDLTDRVDVLTPFSVTTEGIITHSEGGQTTTIDRALVGVPEPLSVLGTSTALGLGAFFKKKKLSSQR